MSPVAGASSPAPAVSPAVSYKAVGTLGLTMNVSESESGSYDVVEKLRQSAAFESSFCNTMLAAAG